MPERINWVGGMRGAYMDFVCPKAPCGTTFWLKIQSFTLRAYPPTCLYVPAEFAPPPNFRDALSSLLQGAENGRDERRLRAVRRAARALRARTGGRALRARSLGGWARGALWGYSEAVPNGKPFRMECYYERKATLK